MQYPVLIDGDSSIAKPYGGLDALPTSVLRQSKRQGGRRCNSASLPKTISSGNIRKALSE